MWDFLITTWQSNFSYNIVSHIAEILPEGTNLAESVHSPDG